MERGRRQRQCVIDSLTSRGVSGKHMSRVSFCMRLLVCRMRQCLMASLEHCPLCRSSPNPHVTLPACYRSLWFHVSIFHVSMFLCGRFLHTLAVCVA
jgi:hypothetical protein